MNKLNEKTWNTASPIRCTEKLCETGVTEKKNFFVYNLCRIKSFLPKKV